MDISTGRTYPTREAALAAGVSESDLAFLVRAADGPRPVFIRRPVRMARNVAWPRRHQGAREQARRLAR